MADYILKEDQLKLVVLLVDFRHAPSADDVLMYQYLKTYQIPVLVVGTKMDKVPKTKRINHEREIKKVLEMDSNDVFIPYSSETHHNREIVLEYLKNFI